MLSGLLAGDGKMRWEALAHVFGGADGGASVHKRPSSAPASRRRFDKFVNGSSRTLIRPPPDASAVQYSPLRTDAAREASQQLRAAVSSHSLLDLLATNDAALMEDDHSGLTRSRSERILMNADRKRLLKRAKARPPDAESLRRLASATSTDGEHKASVEAERVLARVEAERRRALHARQAAVTDEERARTYARLSAPGASRKRAAAKPPVPVFSKLSPSESQARMENMSRPTRLRGTHRDALKSEGARRDRIREAARRTKERHAKDGPPTAVFDRLATSVRVGGTMKCAIEGLAKDDASFRDRFKVWENGKVRGR